MFKYNIKRTKIVTKYAPNLTSSARNLEIFMGHGKAPSPDPHRYRLVAWWLSGWGVDWGPRGRKFDSRRQRYQVTTLGKLFTHVRACVGARGLVAGVDS